jgi:kumamolisin
MAKVEQFAREHRLFDVAADPVRRRIVLAGKAAAMSSAFATDLQQHEHAGGRYRGRTGPLHIPEELDQIVVGVFRSGRSPSGSTTLPTLWRDGNAYSSKCGCCFLRSATARLPLRLSGRYHWKRPVYRSYRTGGGYTNSNLQAYFQKLGIPLPNVTSVSVDGGHNSLAGTPNSSDGEVNLDIEVAGSFAPGASIAVYFAPNTDQGFLDAITRPRMIPAITQR